MWSYNDWAQMMETKDLVFLAIGAAVGFVAGVALY